MNKLRKFTIIDTKTGKPLTDEKRKQLCSEGDLIKGDGEFSFTETGVIFLNGSKSGQRSFTQEEYLIRIDDEYPDLEYLQNIFLANIYHNFPKEYSTYHTDILLDSMFPQTWANTAGGFSAPGVVSGQAFTTQITTVFHYISPTDKEFYGVFFNNTPAYIVDNPNETFIKDLKNKNMKSKYEAEQIY